MKNFSDKELWECSEKAVRGFVKNSFPTFFRFEDLDDMVVETATRVWHSADSFDPARGKFSTWVGVIARNVVLTEAGRLKRERERCTAIDNVRPTALDGFGSLRGAEHPADASLLADELQETLSGKLSGGRDSLLFDWLLDGVGPDEMARRLGVSKQTVYTAVSRLRGTLRCAA